MSIGLASIRCRPRSLQAYRRAPCTSCCRRLHLNLINQVIQRLRKIPMTDIRKTPFFPAPPLLEYKRSYWISVFFTNSQGTESNYFSRLAANNNIICFQEIYGKEVFFSRSSNARITFFQFFGTFFPDNTNAGRSAFCIHQDLSFVDAIVNNTRCHLPGS